MNVVKRSRQGGKRFLVFDRAVREALGVEPTNAEIAEATGLAPDKLTGARNLKRLSDEVAWRTRAHPEEPTSWLRRDVALALQLPEDPETNALVEGFIEAAKRGRDA